MENDEIVDLKVQVKELQAQVADLAAAQNMDRDQTIHALNEITQYLWPMVAKVLPDVAKSLRQMDAIMPPRIVTPESLLKMRNLDGKA
jgi:hypothetical protein